MITIWVPKRLVEVGLYNVAARSPQELAALSEQSYRDRVKYAAEKVRLSGTKIVMLTGPSASGKTTSAHKLAEELIRQGTYAHVVSLDNFFRGAEFYPRLPDGTLDYENPDTMDLPLVRQCLHELSETGPPCPSMILPTSGAPTRPRPWTCRAVSASWRASMP